MNRRAMAFACCASIGAWACGDSSEPLEPRPAFDLRGPTAEGAFVPTWSGNVTVRVITNDHADDIEQAIDVWDSAWDPSANDPSFSMSAGTDTLEVEFTGTGSYYCGDATTAYVHITRQGSGTCPGGRNAESEGQLVYLLMHELGHAIGYESLDSFDATDDCIMNVPANGTPLNQTPCVHEPQLAFWDFGDRDSVDLDLPMISSADLTNLSLDPGDTVWVHPEYDVEGVTPDEAPDWLIDDSTTIARIISRSGDSVRIAALATGNTTLRMELATDPHVVWPAPSTASAPISVSGPPAPDPCFTLEATSTWQFTDQYLDASCSDQGQNIRYRWRFEAGGAWTDTLTSTLFDFEGHSSTGNKIVTLQVIDTSTGRDSTASTTITVSSGTMTVSGDGFITVKATYPYLSSAEAKWYERYPSTSWDESVDWYTDSIARTWPAGEYSVDLRAQDNRNGVLRRGWMPVEVCTQTQNCGEAKAAAPLRSGGSLFGAGPLFTWMDGTRAAALQFYQLMGIHSIASAFATADWLDDENGKVSNAPYSGSVSWERQPLTAGTAYSFTLDPPTTGKYSFGFAVDPDLGTDAADDFSGYDQATGMLYAADQSRAIGFLIRSENGNALATAVQYGTRRFAPASPSRLTQQTSRGGVDLLSGSSDVQFVILADATTGPQKFQLVVLEAETVPALLQLARAVK